jgi:uncharacterized Zn-binding protein involved in type VI secretion
MGKPAARIGDMHVCPMVTPGTPPIPHVGGPITGPGAPTVLIGGMPAAVMGDMCVCVGPPDTIVLGSTGVLIGGKPAARMGDQCAHGGAITVGCPTVLIGETSSGSASGASYMPVEVLLKVIKGMPPKQQQTFTKVIVAKDAAKLGAPYVTPTKVLPLKKDSIVCKFSSLKFADGSRIVMLSNDGSSNSRKNKEILEVVGGVKVKNKKIQVDLIGAAGPCGGHSNNIKVSSLGIEIQGTNSHNVELYSSPKNGFIETLWPRSIPPRSYAVTGDTCGQITSGKVNVYSDAAWDVSIDLKYNEKTSKFGFEEFVIKYTYDNTESTLTLKELPSPIQLFIKVLETTIDAYNGVQKLYEDLTGQKLVEDEYGWHAEYPHIKFSAKWGWEEDKGSTLCKYPITIKFALDPLIGIKGKLDVLGFLINKWAGVGQVINYLRTKVDDSVQLKIDLEFKGTISKSGEISFDLEAGDKDFKLGAANTNTYAMSLTLTGSAEFDVFFVKMGASIEGSTGFSFDFVKIGADKHGVFVEFPLTFSGLVIKGIIYSGADSDVNSGPPKRMDDSKMKYKKESVLVEIGEEKFFEDRKYVNK